MIRYALDKHHSLLAISIHDNYRGILFVIEIVGYLLMELWFFEIYYCILDIFYAFNHYVKCLFLT